jgi:mRNA interferase RelE/StbE
MAYTVIVTPAARRALKKIEAPQLRRIGHAIDALVDDPRPHGAKKLKGTEDKYRLRVGDFRILYTIQDDKLIVTVVDVGDRKDVYR